MEGSIIVEFSVGNETAMNSSSLLSFFPSPDLVTVAAVAGAMYDVGYVAANDGQEFPAVERASNSQVEV